MDSRLSAPPSRHLRDAGRRGPGHRAHHARPPAREPDESPSDRDRLVDRHHRRAGAGTHRARLGRRRHRGALGRLAARAHRRAGVEHAPDARVARRPRGRRRRRPPGAPASSSPGPDLDRRRRPEDAPHGRRHRRRCLHPRGDSSREHRALRPNDPRGCPRGRARPVHCGARRDLPHRLRRRCEACAAHGQVDGRRLLRVLAGALRSARSPVVGSRSREARARAESLARLPPRGRSGGERTRGGFSPRGRCRRVFIARWRDGDHRPTRRAPPLRVGRLRPRGPAPDPGPGETRGPRARLQSPRRPRDPPPGLREALQRT